MRVVHFTTVHKPFDTRIFHKECRTLAAAGHDVTLIASGAPDEVVDGVRLEPIPATSGRLSRAVLGTYRLGRRLAALDADVYHFHDPELLVLASLLSWRRRFVYDAHEWLSADLLSKPYLSPRRAKVMSKVAGVVEHVLARRMVHVVAATPTIAAQFPSDRVTVVHNYPDLDELGDGEVSIDEYSARPRVGGYVGGVTAERCGVEMYDAVASLVADGVGLVVAGPFDDEVSPHDRAGVTYRGVLDRPGVAAVLREVRFGVVLLRAAPNCVDALPTKFFEYAAAGLPVVVSRSTRYLAEIAERDGTGVVVDEEDPASIAQGMRWLLDHPAEAHAMGQRGARAVRERYNWSAEGRSLVGVYEALGRAR